MPCAAGHQYVSSTQTTHVVGLTLAPCQQGWLPFSQGALLIDLSKLLLSLCQLCSRHAACRHSLCLRDVRELLAEVGKCGIL